jgi:hypothetical protein
VLLAREMRHLGIAACTYGGDNAVEAAVARVVDDSASLIVFVNTLHTCIKQSWFQDPNVSRARLSASRFVGDRGSPSSNVSRGGSGT